MLVGVYKVIHTDHRPGLIQQHFVSYFANSVMVSGQQIYGYNKDAMNYQLRKFEITGLFGRNKVATVLLDENDGVSFLTGRNGSGKTTILRLIRALAESDWHTILGVPFSSLVASFQNPNRNVLEINIFEVKNGKQLRAVEDASELVNEKLKSNVKDVIAILHARGVIKKAKCGAHWADSQNSHMTDDVVVKKYKQSISQLIGSPKFNEITRKLSNWNVELFEVKRLYDVATSAGGNGQTAEMINRVVHVPSVIRSKMKTAENLVAIVSQHGIVNDLASILDFQEVNVPDENNLRKRLEALKEDWKQLAKYGLFAQNQSIEDCKELPAVLSAPLRHSVHQKLKETERNIIPLKNVAALIKIFHETIAPTMHALDIEFNKSFGVRFKSQGNLIEPCDLSSGQQHLLYLMKELVFKNQPASLYLIDEPEISMDIEWQRELADRLEQITRINSGRFLLATHSTAIVSERWESCNELP